MCLGGVGGCGSDRRGWLVPGWLRRMCVSRLVPLIGGWVGRVFCVCFGVCCFDVVETSYEGHMVDALASRADEGRWSLR